MKVALATGEDLAEWQAFVDDRASARAMHHAGWYAVLITAFGARPYFLIARDTMGSLCGVLPCYFSRSWITGKVLASLDDGPLTTDSHTASVLITAARGLRERLGARYFLLRTAKTEQVQESDASLRRKTVRRIINTSSPSEAIFAALSPYERRDIRRAEKRGYQIIVDSALEEIDRAFYDQYAASLHRLGTPVMARSMMTSLKYHLGPERIRLLLVVREQTVVGGGLCVIAPSGWTGLYAAAQPDAAKDYANHLLQWHVIKEAAIAGALELDLGRNTPGSGAHQFKKRWPGEDRYLEHLYFADPRRAAPHVEDIHGGRTLKQQLWKMLPLSAANHFGPMLRRQLPFG